MPVRADIGVVSCAASWAALSVHTMRLLARSDSKLHSYAGTPTSSRPLADPRIAQLQAAEAASLASRSSSQFGGQEFWSKLRGFEVEREVSSWAVTIRRGAVAYGSEMQWYWESIVSDTLTYTVRQAALCCKSMRWP